MLGPFLSLRMVERVLSVVADSTRLGCGDRGQPVNSNRDRVIFAW